MKQNFLGNPEEITEETIEKNHQNLLWIKILDSLLVGIIVGCLGCGLFIRNTNNKPVSKESTLVIGDEAIQTDIQNKTVSVEELLYDQNKELFNEKDVKITLESIAYDPSFKEYEMVMHVINNSGKTITVVGETFINDTYFLMGTFYQDSSEAENPKDFTMKESFSVADLNKCGIEEIEKLDIDLSIYDLDRYSIEKENTIYLINQSDYKKKDISKGKNVFENEEVKVVYKGYDEEYEEFLFYCENKSKYELSVELTDMKVNNKSSNSEYSYCYFMSTDVGKRSFEYFDSYDLEDYGISDVKDVQSIQFKVKYRNYEDFDDIYSQTITLSKADLFVPIEY